ncbi:MAG: COX15/CtaA family protein [Pseudomonadota bacterium]
MTLALDPSSPASATLSRDNAELRLVRLWLYGIALLITVMVTVGGATRLTDSGLSITEWKPILGAIPPLNAADWQEAFDKYRQIPEYQEINKGMSLEAFKVINWWEWAHRFLGRIIGLAFFVPAATFWMLGYLPGALKPKIVGLFLLGGLQGAIGWWMVASGLVDRVDVSQYRLGVHLTLAFFLFAAILWVAFGLRQRAAEDHPPFALTGVKILTVLLFLQIFFGALVAGLDAGLHYNTWPLIDDAFIPGGLMEIAPAYLNLFENIKTVQFTHRMLAYLLIAATIAYSVYLFLANVSKRAKIAGILFVVALLWQVYLGIVTLLNAVPIELGLTHQAVALGILALFIWHWRALAGGYRFKREAVQPVLREER